jgi:hypothetical protein
MSSNRRQKISLFVGHFVQFVGFGLGVILLTINAQPGSPLNSSLGVILAYCMVAFTSYASAQVLMGGLMGIRFTHYTVGSSDAVARCTPAMRDALDCVYVISAHADPRSWAQAGWLARLLTRNAGKLAFVTISAAVITHCLATEMLAGPILLAGIVAWLSHNVLVSIYRRTATDNAVRVTAPRRRF